MSDTPSPIALPFSEYRFRFHAIESISFPEFTGSLWRGVFGQALLKHCCGTSPHQPTCLYSRIFEPEKSHYSLGDMMTRHYNHIPTPYIFKVTPRQACTYSPGDEFDLLLLLVGSANQYLQTVIRALKTAAENGLGQSQGKAKLIDVVQMSGQGQQTLVYADSMFFKPTAMRIVQTPDFSSPLRVSLQMPLNLGDKGKEFLLSRFLMGVVRRVSLLQLFYGDSPLDVDFVNLKQQAAKIQAKTRLSSAGWKRYSSRKKMEQPLKGWVGELFLQGEGLEALWPYLYLGQWLHTGKSTNMGLGRYQIEYVHWQ